MANNLLITGVPGVGKTTAMIRLAKALPQVQPAGFVTREIRDGGARTGFELVSCSGVRRILAHVALQHPYRVGKYSVDIPGFEMFLGGIPLFSPGARLVLVDEIGKMECASPLFQETILRVLDASIPFVATIARKGPPFIERIRRRRDVMLVEVTLQNRDSIHDHLLTLIRNMLDNFP